MIAIIVDPKEHKKFKGVRATTTAKSDQGEINESSMEGLEGVLHTIMVRYYNGRPWRKVRGYHEGE